MTNDVKNQYEFGRFRLDGRQRLLLLDLSPVHVAPKAFELLAYFVEHPNQVLEKEVLLNEVWKDSFVEESNLAVHISNLRKILVLDPENTSAIETFPKVGYRFVAEVKRVGGIGYESPSNGPAESQLRRPLIAVVLFLLAAFSGLGLYYSTRPPTVQSKQQITSIAVLPFVNESGDPDYEFLTDGITETLIRGLSQIPGLSVKARASVFFYKGKTVDPRQIGKDISAQAILMGRVARNLDLLTVTFELIDSQSGNVITTERYELAQGDIVQIHDAILHSVSKELRKESADPGARPFTMPNPKNREAYELYLRGRFYAARRTVADIKTSVGYFRKAIEVDPSFALAHSGLSDSTILLANWGAMPMEEALPQARNAALKAIELAPDLAEAQTSLGETLTDPIEKERRFRRAVELNPSYAQAYQWHAELLEAMGRFDEAKVSIQRSIELDPLSRICRNIDGRISLFAGRHNEAIAIFKKNIELDPTWGGDHDLMFHAFVGKGMYPEAVDAYLTALILLNEVPQSEILLTREAFLKGGFESFLRRRLKYLEEKSKREHVRPFQLAEFHSLLRQNDKAFPLLNKAFETPSINRLGWLKYLPSFESIRSDPRFDEFLLRNSTPR